MTRRMSAPWGDYLEDDSLVGLALFDRHGVPQRANRAFRSWWGVEDAEGGEADRALGSIQSVLEGLVSPGDSIVRGGVELPTGKVVRLHVQRLSDGFALTAVDVTEERQVAEAAWQSVDRYRELIDVSLDGMVLAIDGNIQLFNEAFATMLGYARDELEGVELSRLTTPASHGTIMEAIRSQDERPYEVVALRKDGSTFPARIRARNVHVRGEPARLTVVTDLSAEREAERALEERERRYQELAELLPVAVLEMDLTGRVTFANACAMAAFAWCEPTGAPLAELVSEAEREVLLGALRGDTGGQTVTFRRSDGQQFEGRVFGAEIVRRSRAVGMRAVVVPHDELPESDLPPSSFRDPRRMESLAVLAGGLAHDFNNLLAVVRGNADLARRRLPSDHPARSAVDAIGQAATQGAMVTAKLLASSGTEPLGLEPVQLSQVVETSIDTLWDAVDGRAQLRLHIEPDLGWVRGASGQLSTAIVNLVLNAAEAVEPTGWIDLEVRALSEAEVRERGLPGVGAWVCLRVRDDGCGMAPEIEARAFEPFFSTKFAGRGLGLSAVQGIVHSHGGMARLESQPGRGTTVEICLPRHASLEGPSPVARPAPRPERKAIVIADDEAPLRLMLRAMLEDLGYEVLATEDGVECLEALRARPDVAAVILDATMPRMGGAEVMRLMGEEGIEVPVVLCSGFPADVAPPGDRDRFRFLAKPFGLDELERTLLALAGAP